jgi:phenylacetate-CoA ligase/benzoylacetate-CoA ligase
VSLDARYWDRDFESRPWAWVEAWQAQQLAIMLESLPHRSELYRDLLSAAGSRVGLRGYWVSRGRLPSLEMLETIPFTTREQLHEAQAATPPGRPLGLQQAVPQQYIVQIVTSAYECGGRPLLSALTRRDQETWSDAVATSLWTAGIRPEDIVAHLVSSPSSAAGWPYADGLRRLGATVAWLGCLPADQLAARLPQLHVTTVLGPSNGGAREGSSRARQVMGVAEVMAGMWAECCHGDGMHFNAGKYVIVELIDPRAGGRVAWTDGATGEAVYTTFDRDATPVLRFRSGDLLEVTGTRCACGRTAPRVRYIGRADVAGEPALVGVKPV